MQMRISRHDDAYIGFGAFKQFYLHFVNQTLDGGAVLLDIEPHIGDHLVVSRTARM